MRVTFVIACLAVFTAAVPLALESEFGGYGAHMAQGQAATEDTKKAVKAKLDTAIANAKNFLKTAKGKAKEGAKTALKNMENIKKDLPKMTQADGDAIMKGAGEVGKAIGLFAKGDPASIAQGVIIVGQQLWSLAKGFWGKIKEYRANKKARTGKAQIGSMSQTHASNNGWLVQKVSSDQGLGQTAVKSVRQAGQSFAQAAASAIRATSF